MLRLVSLLALCRALLPDRAPHRTRANGSRDYFHSDLFARPSRCRHCLPDSRSTETLVDHHYDTCLPVHHSGTRECVCE